MGLFSASHLKLWNARWSYLWVLWVTTYGPPWPHWLITVLALALNELTLFSFNWKYYVSTFSCLHATGEGINYPLLYYFCWHSIVHMWDYACNDICLFLWRFNLIDMRKISWNFHWCFEIIFICQTEYVFKDHETYRRVQYCPVEYNYDLGLSIWICMKEHFCSW